MERTTDILIIGSGVAGLTFALGAADRARVLILAKGAPDDSSTNRAQGGIAAALDPVGDSLERHVRDTMEAGAGLCDRKAVEICINGGPDRIRWLQEQGVDFARRQDGNLDLGREGGHSSRRVAHVRDQTGRSIQAALLAAADAHPNITILDRWMAIELITRARLQMAGDDRCLGCYAMEMETGQIVPVHAAVTVLATGGAGKVYLYTTNPDVATGDGIAMAWRCGARIANMEFYQFHPTCLYHPLGRSFLISEAVRGEGGRLVTARGRRFMPEYHDQAELAPRDVVARAIDSELKRTGDDCVYLDLTGMSGDFISERFPTIFQTCFDLGIDARTDPVPVVPAAHYQCGGVVTDVNGWTGISGLYAIGETACTGLHGANRLASNSLLEGVVFGHRAAMDALKYMKQRPKAPVDLPPWHTGLARDHEEAVVVSQAWHEIRRFMWNYVGLVRSEGRLARARRRLMNLREEIRSDYWAFLLTPSLVELRNLADVAYLILEMASMRRESRGLHYIIDFPDRDDDHWNRNTVLHRSRVRRMSH